MISRLEKVFTILRAEKLERKKWWLEVPIGQWFVDLNTNKKCQKIEIPQFIEYCIAIGNKIAITHSDCGCIKYKDGTCEQKDLRIIQQWPIIMDLRLS
jgi:hypothetical protein